MREEGTGAFAEGGTISPRYRSRLRASKLSGLASHLPSSGRSNGEVSDADTSRSTASRSASPWPKSMWSAAATWSPASRCRSGLVVSSVTTDSRMHRTPRRVSVNTVPAGGLGTSPIFHVEGEGHPPTAASDSLTSTAVPVAHSRTSSSVCGRTRRATSSACAAPGPPRPEAGAGCRPRPAATATATATARTEPAPLATESEDAGRTAVAPSAGTAPPPGDGNRPPAARRRRPEAPGCGSRC